MSSAAEKPQQGTPMTFMAKPTPPEALRQLIYQKLAFPSRSRVMTRQACKKTPSAAAIKPFPFPPLGPKTTRAERKLRERQLLIDDLCIQFAMCNKLEDDKLDEVVAVFDKYLSAPVVDWVDLHGVFRIVA
jgi:hypothetical protein